MTQANLLKLHKHFVELSEGRFNERSFDSEVKAKNSGDEEGTIIQGKMNSARRELIISDAKRHRMDMEEKYPQLVNTGPQKPVQTSKPILNTKPKGVKKDG